MIENGSCPKGGKHVSASEHIVGKFRNQPMYACDNCNRTFGA